LRPAAVEAFRRKAGQRPLVYGHRGARARAPENTIEAFELALSEGADGIELDVRMTADGELVVLHDGHVQLEAGRVVPVHRLSLAQVKSLALRSGTLVPTLSEVLTWHHARGKLTNVEIKGDVPHARWLGRKTAECIRDHGTTGLLLSSFHPGLVWQMARLLPDVPIALLVEAGRLGAVQRALGGWKRLGASGVHPERRLLDAIYLRPFIEAGALVNTWTVNDPAEALCLSALGVDGIVTDRPLEILAALQQS
jgi:glycerophosphoryl diester phosphodiesterase